MATATENPEQFHAERRSGIGGSDASAVCGVNPWRTPLDVFREKLGLGVDVQESPAMRWGNLLEDTIAEEYSRVSGHTVRRDRRMLRHKRHRHMVCHLDRRVPNSKRIVEAKTVGKWSKLSEWGEEGSDEIPPYYLTQAHHNMIVAGATVCDVPVLIAGQDFRVYTVNADKKIADGLIEIEREFWRSVESKEAPADPLNQFVRERYPFSKKETKIATDTEIALALQLLEVHDEQEDCAARRDVLERELCAFLGEADQLKIGSRIAATWSTQTSYRVSSDELKEKYPDLVQALKKPSVSRPFKIKKDVLRKIAGAKEKAKK